MCVGGVQAWVSGMAGQLVQAQLLRLGGGGVADSEACSSNHSGDAKVGSVLVVVVVVKQGGWHVGG